MSLTTCSRCSLRALRSRAVGSRGLRAASSYGLLREQPAPREISIAVEDDLTFNEVTRELHRRQKRVEDKRKQHGGGQFVDFLRVTVRGGKGGAGTAAFVPTKKGLGPASGGNGGPGGSVYLMTAPNLSSLSMVGKRLIGEQGGNGGGDLRHGKRGEDIIVRVPVGTVIREIKREGEPEKNAKENDAMGLTPEERRQRTRERWLVKHPNLEVGDRDMKEAENLLRESGRWSARTPTFEIEPPIMLDVAEPLEKPILLSRGGVGGLGNPHFVSARFKHPRIASRGVLPHTKTFEFELKLLADVGLVGLPNAGKSTLLRSLTGRRAEVANYAFTTLNPQIGVVRILEDGTWAAIPEGPVEETELERQADNEARLRGDYKPLPRTARRKIPERFRFSVSDNPGLLERASENVGLGHSFLRSIERSLALAYILDARRPDPAADYRVLRAELEAYKPGLATRAKILALNKADELPKEEVEEKAEKLRAAVAETETEAAEPPTVLVISAKFGDGVDRLVHILGEAVDAARPKVKAKKVVAAPVVEEAVEREEDLFEL